MPEPTPSLSEFIRAYEQATNSHDTTRLEPLIASDAVYWFSDGSHRGTNVLVNNAGNWQMLHEHLSS